jgi:hypothetical protein
VRLPLLDELAEALARPKGALLPIRAVGALVDGGLQASVWRDSSRVARPVIYSTRLHVAEFQLVKTGVTRQVLCEIW